MSAANLASGARLGPYEVVALLGAGGMGEVYRARDTRLGRDIAIKVLPSDVAHDADRRARFEREARAVAALDHPHICAIYDVGDASGTHYLVMPLLDGQTLATRLARGALPLDDGLRVACEIADALDKAHRQGIVHRDLKPANVMLTKTGAKLLDFGLAKLKGTSPAVALSSATDAHTTAVDTARGTILGTVHYMAPEQVEGREADARTDLWAFGALLYEMVTGTRAFSGDTPASVIGAILKDPPPDVAARVPASPPLLNRIIARCLAKDPDERWQSAADVHEALRWVKDDRPLVPSARASDGTRLGMAKAAGLVAAGVLTGVVALSLTRGSTAPATALTRPEVVRFQLTLPAGLTLVPEQPPAVSPDGKRLALVAIDRESGRRQIYLRSLNSVAAQALGDTLDAQYPFWSEDGSRLAFFARSRLRVIELASGAVLDVAPAPNPAGPGQWAGNAMVYPRSTGPVVSVTLGEGAPRNISPFDAARESNQSLVGVLPDGRVLVSSQAGLFVVSADGTTDSLITDDITMPAALFTLDSVTTGKSWALMFIQNGRLMTQAFDPTAASLRGDPLAIAQEASRLVTPGARPMSAGGDVLAFVSRSDIETRPMWVDRRGTVLGPVASVSGQLRDLRLSPDGTRLSVSRLSAESKFELLLVDLHRDTTTHLAPGLSFQQAAWSGDGKQLVGLGQQGTGGRAILAIAPQERATPELLLRPAGAVPSSVSPSPDGKHLCYVRTDNAGDFDIFVRAVSDQTEGLALLPGPAYESSCRISPDGRWFAYHSNENGVLNVFVRSFPSGRDKLQVSVDGGQRPAWRSDGRELYYLTPDGGLMAVSLEPGTPLKIGSRSRLFTASVDPTFGSPGATLFDPARDGQRFAMLVPTSDTPQPVTVILNWRSLLPAQ